MTGRPRARRELRRRRSSCTSTGSCATPALFSCEQGGGQRDPGVPSPAGRGGWPPGQRRGETLAGGGAGPGGRAGGEGREAAAVVRVGGVCVCVCVFRGRVVGSTGGLRGSSGVSPRAARRQSGGFWAGPARPCRLSPPSLAMPAGSPPAPCCLVDRSSRGSLALSRCRAGGGLCPRAALPFRIRTNRVLCQGAQRAPARGSPVFCWAGEGVFPLPRCFYK